MYPVTNHLFVLCSLATSILLPRMKQQVGDDVDSMGDEDVGGASREEERIGVEVEGGKTR